MASVYNMVVGITLVDLLVLMAGMLLAGVWRHLMRQLTRGGLVEFPNRCARTAAFGKVMLATSIRRW